MKSAGLTSEKPSPAVMDHREDRREHPWPGLAPYLEAEGDTFFGRDREADDLLRRVRRDVLTVLFGPSGTGKTSLINAGLFSRLRQKRFLPVPIRLSLDRTTLSDGGTTIVGQVKSRLQEVVAEYGLEIDSLAEPAVSEHEETLWEFFHRVEFWDAQNQPITPVLVFDQFEEIFTLGHNLPEVKLFLTELADLVENHIPHKVRRRMAHQAEKLKFPYANQHYRIVLSLREDFVAHLDNLHPEMPAVMHNRCALKHMNGEQALEAVLGPGKGVVDTQTARQIVRFVGAAGGHQQALEELEIEPALLNVVCRELNLRRLRDRSEQITAALLSGSQEAILADFYERSITDLGPEVRIFIEDDLLTASGYRDNMAVEDVYQKYSLTPDTIACLVDRRLLRMDDRLRIQRVELIHDLLTGVAQQSRDRRKEREQQERERRQARDLHRKLRRSRLVMLAFAGITICAVYFMVLMVSSKSQVAKSAEELLYNGIIRKARISVSENPRTSLLLAMEAYAAYRGKKGRLAVTAEETFRDIVARVSGNALDWAPGSAAERETSLIRAIRFSNDGRWLGGAGGRLGLVWDVGGETRLRQPILLKGHQAEILALEFHPLKPWVATAGRDHKIRIWNLEKGLDGRLKTVLRGNASTVFSIPFSAPGFWRGEREGGAAGRT